MKPIDGRLTSFFQKLERKQDTLNRWPLEFEYEKVWKVDYGTVNQIRACDGYPVTSFRQLINEVAKVTIWNKNYEMFYRGQSQDYKNNQSSYGQYRTPKSIIYPTICRPDIGSDGKMKYSIKKSQIIGRYDNLSKMTRLFKNHFRNDPDEFYYALFQHYEAIATPLIDITQSLRVAASFALSKSKSGYLYVFGLPYPNQSISHFMDLGITLIKLQNVVPINALRPRYQEGFLVGKYPFSARKTNDDDLANRMVAKFFIDDSKDTFWDDHFTHMPEEILYPKGDHVAQQLEEFKIEFYKKLKN